MQRGVAIFSFHHRNFPKPSADHLTHGVLMASMHPAGDSYNHRPSDLQKLYATMDSSRHAVSALRSEASYNLKGVIIT